jgi:sigma-B regulation protein RsbU (phosphoserine phosphatase)
MKLRTRLALEDRFRQQVAATLGEGDILFFYTDGITEVENEKGEMFGSDRLEALLIKHHGEGVDALLARIEQEVLQFRGDADLFDDVTMMVLRLGASAPKEV